MHAPQRPLCMAESAWSGTLSAAGGPRLEGVEMSSANPATGRDEGGRGARRGAPEPLQRPRSSAARALRGFGLLFDGYRFLRSHRPLWGLAVIPVLFSVIAIGLATLGIVSYAGELMALIRGLLPMFQVEQWYQWLWLGPLIAFFWVLGAVIFVVLSGLAIMVSVMIASVAAAPFLDVLAYRTEALLEGRVVESDQSGLAGLAGDVGRSMWGEAQRTATFLAVWIPLVFVGLVVPGAQLVTAPALYVLTALFLPLDFAGYTLDRRRIPFAERRAWIQGDLALMGGFGTAAFVACFVPGLNLLMIPVLVVAGTLLAVRYGPPPRV